MSHVPQICHAGAIWEAPSCPRHHPSRPQAQQPLGLKPWLSEGSLLSWLNHPSTHSTHPSVHASFIHASSMYRPCIIHPCSIHASFIHASSVHRSCIIHPCIIHASFIHASSMHRPCIIYPCIIHASFIHASFIHASFIHASSIYASSMRHLSIHSSLLAMLL